MPTPQLSGSDSLQKKSLFSGLSWWQVVLSIAPLAVIGMLGTSHGALGGMLGGGIGGGAMMVNLNIAARPLNLVVKLLLMLAASGIAYGIYFVIAPLVFSA